MLHYSLFIASILAIQLMIANTMPIKVASVFRNDEIIYHKYAAVLAAAEPFRLQFEKDIETYLNPVQYLCRKLFKSSLKKTIEILRQKDGELDVTCSRYEKRVDDIVR